MELIKSNGQTTFINDEGIETYKKYLYNQIIDNERNDSVKNIRTK